MSSTWSSNVSVNIKGGSDSSAIELFLVAQETDRILDCVTDWLRVLHVSSQDTKDRRGGSCLAHVITMKDGLTDSSTLSLCRAGLPIICSSVALRFYGKPDTVTAESLMTFHQICRPRPAAVSSHSLL